MPPVIPAIDTSTKRTKRRLGKQRGRQIARVELARELATALWSMLTRQSPFRLDGPADRPRPYSHP